MLQEEKLNLKNDILPIKTKHRELESQYNITLRKIEEKSKIKKFYCLKNSKNLDNQMLHHEEENLQLIKKLKKQKEMLEQLSINNNKLLENNENIQKKSDFLEQNLKDIKQQRNEYK